MELALKKTPVVNLARQIYYRYRFRGLVFDVWRHFENREPRQIYRSAEARMAPRPIEQRVIRELKETGISIIQLSDLLPGQMFSEIQEWTEARLRAAEIQEIIKVVEGGGRPDTRAASFTSSDLSENARLSILEPPSWVLASASRFFGLFVAIWRCSADLSP